MENIEKYITIDPGIQSGQPVFSGTRVPVETLFWHLEKGISMDDFLEDFTCVSREQAIGVLEIAHKILTSGNIAKIYEAVAWWEPSKETKMGFQWSRSLYCFG